MHTVEHAEKAISKGW